MGSPPAGPVKALQSRGRKSVSRRRVKPEPLNGVGAPRGRQSGWNRGKKCARPWIARGGFVLEGN